MPSETTLNAKNLAALGAECLAELLLDVTASDAAATRGKLSYFATLKALMPNVQQN